MPLDVAAFGEIGLTGQVRPVAQGDARVREASRLGMKRVLGATGVAASRSAASSSASALERVATLADALGVLT